VALLVVVVPDPVVVVVPVVPDPVVVVVAPVVVPVLPPPVLLPLHAARAATARKERIARARKVEVRMGASLHQKHGDGA
jgi:hypothetical protein